MILLNLLNIVIIKKEVFNTSPNINMLVSFDRKDYINIFNY